MNGAEALLASAVAVGIDVCFANPGTTELPLVRALDTVPGIRGILCLHENVATGAADGYGRMLGKPAMCLLHLGPGLANGLTNLHNARRACTPLVNVIGEHATWHLAADPLLASPIESLARAVSAHVTTAHSAADLAAELSAAHDAAVANVGQISTLIVPHDILLAEAQPPSVSVASSHRRRSVPAQRIEAALKALLGGQAALLLGHDALTEVGLALAGRIASATGATLLCDTFVARMERGAGLPEVTKLPYFPDMALALTQKFAKVIMAGTRRPVAFFGYAGLPSFLTREDQTLDLADPGDDVLGALNIIADQLPPSSMIDFGRSLRPAMPRGPLDAHAVSAVIARLQPENCIVMDEALTVGVPYFDLSKGAPRFSHLMLTGGAIGQGPSSATGAAIACPDRKVINYQSDGCGAYSVQAFWTQARQGLDVVTIIGSNRSYNILKVELMRAGVPASQGQTHAMAALEGLDWVRIGEGFGVPSVAVSTAEDLARELERALCAKGPRLIEAIMT